MLTRSKEFTPVLNVLTPDLEPRGTLPSFASLTVKMSFFDVGHFEFTLPATPRTRELLQAKRVVDFGQDGQLAGIIRGIHRTLGPGGVTLRVYGPLLKGLMAGRRALPSDDPELLGWDVASGTVGSIMAHYVTNHAISPVQAVRRIPLLQLAPGIERIGMETVAKARFDLLSDVLRSVGQYASVGWDIVIAGEDHYEFQALAPVDRTSESDDPLVLSTAFKNISTAEADTDLTDYANTVYALGEGEYEHRLYQVYYAGDEPVSGWDRFETVADCGNESSIARLRDLALQKMDALEQTESMTLELMAGRTDARVGDLLTVALPEIDAAYDLLLTEMEIHMQGARTTRTVTLGKPPRTLEGQLQRTRRLSNIT